MNVILWATHLRSLAAVHFELEPGFYQLGRSTPDDPPDKLAKLQGLFRPYDPKRMKTRAVSTYVNSPRNEGEQCIEPV